jgi:hypothetical protein
MFGSTKDLKAYDFLKNGKQTPGETTSLFGTTDDSETQQQSSASSGAASILQQFDTANSLSALNYMKDQLSSVKALASQGPLGFRVLALLAGIAMSVQSGMGIFGKILSFSPLQALISAYCFLFGLTAVILESATLSASLKPIREWIEANLKVLTLTWGRGVFYFFAGSLMFSLCTVFDFLVGGFMCFVGFTHIVVGRVTAGKLSALRSTLSSESVLKSKFEQYDVDGNGTLDKVELANLCNDLGSPLDHNELVAALLVLDKNKDAQISFEEFKAWWTGWDGSEMSMQMRV